MRMARSRTITPEIGMEYPSAAAPARLRTSRISSVAYATDDNASEENTASAIGMPSRSPRYRSVSSGVPRSQRFQLMSLHQEVDCRGDDDPVPRERAQRVASEEGEEPPDRGA